MSSSVAVAYTSLLYLLTIQFYVIAHIYTIISKPIVSVSLASRVTYEVISYLAVECIT
jgi:hypothetical protein